MAEYSNENRGSIWPAKEKKTDKHPDFEGSQNVCCPKCNQATDYWVSAWRKKPDAAERAPSLTWKNKPKDGKPKDAPRPATGGGGLDFEDSIPFGPDR
jgi:hypothetical protein